MKQLNINEAYALTGKSREAELLRILSFWQGLAKTKRNGKVWVVKTAEELIQDGMTCSKCTIYRTLKKLAAKDLIEIRHWPHRYKSGKLHSTWVRVTIDK